MRSYQHSDKHKHISLNRNIVLSLVFLLALAYPFAPSWTVVKAQEDTTGWATPINLSNTGSARKPVLLTNSSDMLSVLWQDYFNGYQFSRGVEAAWEDPIGVPLTFLGTLEPTKYMFLSDQKGYIYFLWIDDRNTLHYSINDTKFSNKFSRWTGDFIISRNVSSFTVKIDEQGNAHIMFIVGLDNEVRPAGIYYTQLYRNGDVSITSEIDQSPYYRSLARNPNDRDIAVNDQAEIDINVIGAGRNSSVFVVWNNPQTKRLFFKHSENGGSNWADRIEVVLPEDSVTSLMPEHPMLGISGNSLFLFWQYIQEGLPCQQLYQYSNDHGESWSNRQGLYEDLKICPSQIQLVNGPNEKSILFAVLYNDAYISTWDGLVFSSPQRQPNVAYFKNSANLSNVRLENLHAFWYKDRLYVTGNGGGNSGDVWVTSHQVDGFFNSDISKSTWSFPEVIAKAQTNFESLYLLIDRTKLSHAFWSQPESPLENEPYSSIYYVNWRNPGQKEPVLTIRSQNGKAKQLSIAVDASNTLYATWSGGKAGDLFFSWGSVGPGSASVDWFTPISIPEPFTTTEQPKIWIGADGAIYVAFLVPLNEERGVYITRTTDRGQNWSQPSQVFDATSVDCQMVDQFSYAVSPKGVMHLSWVCGSIPGGIGSISLRYARSADNGQSWTTTTYEGDRKILWSQLTVSPQGKLLRIWEELSDGRLSFQHQVSNNDGQTWDLTNEIYSTDSQVGPISITLDPAGNAYLVFTQQDRDKIMLNYWRWDNTSWTAGDSKNLGEGSVQQVKNLASSVNPEGNLAVLYVMNSFDIQTNFYQNNLTYISHPIEIPRYESVAAPTLKLVVTAAKTPTKESMEQKETVEAPPPTPTIDYAALTRSDTNNNLDSVMAYGISATVSLIIVAAIFVLRIRSRR